MSNLVYSFSEYSEYSEPLARRSQYSEYSEIVYKAKPTNKIHVNKG